MRVTVTGISLTTAIESIIDELPMTTPPPAKIRGLWAFSKVSMAFKNCLFSMGFLEVSQYVV